MVSLKTDIIDIYIYKTTTIIPARFVLSKIFNKMIALSTTYGGNIMGYFWHIFHLLVVSQELPPNSTKVNLQQLAFVSSTFDLFPLSSDLFILPLICQFLTGY